LLLVGCDSTVQFEEDDAGQVLVQNLNDERLASLGDDLPFGCLLSTLSDDPDRPYLFRRIELRFPEHTRGTPVRRTYVVADADAPSHAARTEGDQAWGILRLAQCVIPDIPGLERRVEEKLKGFGRSSWARENAGRALDKNRSDGRDDDSVSTMDICMTSHTVYICQQEDGVIVYDTCSPVTLEFYFTCPDGPNDPTDQELEDIGWYDDDPYGPCGELNPDPYCWVEGGSGSPGGDPDPCDGDNPPARCSNPCQTGDPRFDDVRVELGLEQLWLGTNFGDGTTPYDQRLETLGVVVPVLDGYSMWRASEVHYVKQKWDIAYLKLPSYDTFPEGSIIVHSHPFHEGEPFTTSTGQSAEYTPIPSNYDTDLLALTRSDGTPVFAGAAFIDNEGIHFFDKHGNVTLFIDRCGY
jgi:hypothetical protein